MANLVLRNIDDGVYKGIKVRSAQAGMTVKEYVLWALETEVGAGEAPRGESTDNPEPRREAVRGSDAEAELGEEIPEGTASCEVNVLNPVSAKILEQRAELSAKAKGQLEKVMETPFGREHDPKTCRVYRCTLCSLVGVKNKARGLE